MTNADNSIGIETSLQGKPLFLPRLVQELTFRHDPTSAPIGKEPRLIPTVLSGKQEHRTYPNGQTALIEHSEEMIFDQPIINEHHVIADAKEKTIGEKRLSWNKNDGTVLSIEVNNFQDGTRTSAHFEYLQDNNEGHPDSLGNIWCYRVTVVSADGSSTDDYISVDGKTTLMKKSKKITAHFPHQERESVERYRKGVLTSTEEKIFKMRYVKGDTPQYPDSETRYLTVFSPDDHRIIGYQETRTQHRYDDKYFIGYTAHQEETQVATINIGTGEVAVERSTLKLDYQYFPKTKRSQVFRGKLGKDNLAANLSVMPSAIKQEVFSVQRGILGDYKSMSSVKTELTDAQPLNLFSLEMPQLKQLKITC